MRDILFETPIWHLECTDKSIVKELKEWAIKYEREHKSINMTNRGGYHGPNETEIKKLPCIDYFKERLSFLPNCYVDNWWLNVQRKDNYNVEHCHGAAALSLIWYITDNNNTLVFRNENEYARHGLWHMFDYPLARNWNAKAGDIVMFPSDVPHRVEPHTGNTPRMSIALNISPKG